MNEPQSAMSTIYSGWETHQSRIIAAISPLSAEQLALRVSPTHRTLEEIVTHVIGARSRWFMMDEGDSPFKAFARWDRDGMPVRSTAELVNGLETTWQEMQAAIARWTPAEWQQTFPGEPPEEPAEITRMWVIWHLIEHDLHHGGEISLVLGMNGLAAPDI
jgi:uncharacterized damage-inducible protein DinB